MFLALAGGIMLAVWVFKHLKPKDLLIVIIAAIVAGLLGSYLTFETEMQFFSQILGKKTGDMGDIDEQHMMEMKDMMKMMDMMKTQSGSDMKSNLPEGISQDEHESHHPETLSGQGIGPNSIYVADQKPGMSMSAFQVQLESPGFVVIHKDNNGDFGSIIGSSSIVQPGTTNNISISLSEPVGNGLKLYAMIHKDDGDGKFDASKDLTVKDGFGNMMHMIFYVSDEAEEPTAVL